MSRTPIENIYDPPSLLPQKNSHPRLFINKEELSRVKKDLSLPEHTEALGVILANARATLSAAGIYEARRYEIIRAKAFLYLLKGDAEAGKEAVEAVINDLENVNIPEEMRDNCRAYGNIMFTAACVYDWCYPLCGKEWREKVVYLCETELAPHFEVGFPPSKQGNLVSHGCEAQVLRDWLSLAIAAYDEYPDIYGFIEGRIEKHIVPLHDFYYRSHSHWQGSSYGPYRFQFDLIAETLIRAATGGKRLFSDDMHEAALTFLYYLRPDNEAFRIGDDTNDYKTDRYDLHMYVSMAGFSGALYRDPVLRGYFLSGKHSFDNNEFFCSPEIFLLTDRPETGTAPLSSLPSVRYCPSPLGMTIARTGNGKDDCAVYMKIGEAYTANHEQRDAGDFMIFRGGSLASASNCYEYTSKDGGSHRYGSLLDFAYNKQTVSHNCLLVFDPEEKGAWSKLINSGGQCIDLETSRESDGMAEWKAKRCFSRAKITAHSEKTKTDGSPDYCLLSGDLTRSYSEKIVDYQRTMLAVFTGEKERPLSFFVYDNVTSRKAEFKKTWLLHTTEEPLIRDNVAVIKGKDGGNAVLTPILPEEKEISAIGGENNRFNVNGTNIAADEDKNLHPAREDGWGRIEIRNGKDEENTVFLNVIDVRPDETSDAEKFSGEGFCGASQGNTVVIFPLGNGYGKEISFVLPKKEKSYRIFITGITGKWRGERNEYTASKEEKMLVLNASGGEKIVLSLL